MPWGKFRGIPLTKIDASYLCWLLDNAEQARPNLRAAILTELGSRFGTKQPPPSPSRKPCPDPQLAAEIIAIGRRTLAKKHHPDAGGDTKTAQLLNAAADWLQAQVPQ